MDASEPRSVHVGASRRVPLFSIYGFVDWPEAYLQEAARGLRRCAVVDFGTRANTTAIQVNQEEGSTRMDIKVGAKGDCTYTLPNAKLAIAGFCFGTGPLTGFGGTDPKLGATPLPTTRRLWAYRTYDCSAPSDGVELRTSDLGAATALDLYLAATVHLTFASVLPVINAELAQLPVTVKFWELIAANYSSPGAHTPEWHLLRCYEFLYRAPEIGVATASRALHHCRPHQFLLLDSLTVAAYPAHGAWKGVCTDLQAQSAVFEDLEMWFSALRGHLGGVNLTRLRIHDILLWLCRKGDADAAIAAGAEVAKCPEVAFLFD
jgi:hypothetical protein